MTDRSPSRRKGSTAAADRRTARADEKRQKKEAKAQRRAERGPGPFAQIKQVFRITKEHDSNITLKLVAIALCVLLVFLLIGLLLGNWITWLLIGIPFAVLIAFWFLSRRAEKAAFARIEDQPGATGAALSTLRRGWIVEEQPVQIDPRSRDLVFRAVGRPGVVLVTEGPTGRARKLADKERRRIGPRIRNVPIHIIPAGAREDQVPLNGLAQHMKGLDKKLTKQEVSVVHQRLASIPANQLPIPKGVDPMRARPDRKSLRGR
ncbi:DUF4191 domain-containing protein [Kocuria palustris]|uniref:DUF4191 domain-containing protein n=1 Tax=Kocuria palustris TaxID=71999 RepID=UPI0011A787AD|nr:DUF4191 domain-containing protein [Kocuria palustris]